jgi:hypothetical protein
LAGNRHEQLRDELEFVEDVIRRIESAGIESNRAGWLAARVALALYAASKNGPALGDELRRWCALEWGCAIPVAELEKRLAHTGFTVLR